MTESYEEEIRKALGNALGMKAEDFSVRHPEGNSGLITLSVIVPQQDLPDIEKRAQLMAPPQIEQFGSRSKVTFTVADNSGSAVKIQQEGQTALRNRIAEDLVRSTLNMGKSGKTAQKRILDIITRDLGLDQIQRT